MICSADQRAAPRPNLTMTENTERWMELAAQASVEQDPDKLLKIVEELLQLLEEKERRLRKTAPPHDHSEKPGT